MQPTIMNLVGVLYMEATSMFHVVSLSLGIEATNITGIIVNT